jgi:hypothetical protein
MASADREDGPKILLKNYFYGFSLYVVFYILAPKRIKIDKALQFKYQ